MRAIPWRQLFTGAVQPAVDGPQADPTGVGPIEAGDQVEERRLAGAVGPDQAEDLAGADLEVDAVERLQAAERLAQPLDDEQRLPRGGVRTIARTVDCSSAAIVLLLTLGHG